MEEGVYLLKLELENVRCFGEKAMLDLSDGQGNWKNWTVILGDNGTGKTTLLQIICSLRTLDTDKKVTIWFPAITGQRKVRFLSTKFRDDTFSIYDYPNAQAALKMTTTLAKSLSVPDISVVSTFLQSGLDRYSIYNAKYYLLKMYGYGATRFMSLSSTTDSRAEDCATLFNDDARLRNAEEWLLQLDYSASKQSPIQEFAIKRRNQAKEILLDLLPDIKDIRFTEPTINRFQTVIEFQTTYGWVTIHQLSLGYKTMVAWMVDLAARLFERYPDSHNPLAQPAIVLVDEIDLHMHPKWQRQIFDHLTKTFPQTQFIVTAHSPLIVQSAPKDANIVLLRREGDHVVIDNDILSVHNWRVDQILNSDLFGNISQRTTDVEKWMNEREELLQKEKLTKEEKKRLKELEEQADQIPTADNQRDIDAMEIIRKAADYLKTQTV